MKYRQHHHSIADVAIYPETSLHNCDLNQFLQAIITFTNIFLDSTSNFMRTDNAANHQDWIYPEHHLAQSVHK
jgi:hypothetical protein